MNITIRTYDELRSNRVSIEVAAGEKAEITVDGETSARLFTEDEVINAQASEGELIGKALRADLERQRKITRDLEGHYQRKLAEAFSLADRYAEELDKLRAELTQVENSAGVSDAEAREAHRLLKEADGRADRLVARANELETELAEINQRAKTFRDQAYEQNDRAAELRQQIKELKAELSLLRESSKVTDAEGRKADRRIHHALHELSTPGVEEALEMAVTPISVRLAGAIRNARRILKDDPSDLVSPEA